MNINMENQPDGLTNKPIVPSEIPQNELIYFLSFSVFMAGIGRLISMSIVGLPSKIFLIYLLPELILPLIMVVSQIVVNRKKHQL